MIRHLLKPTRMVKRVLVAFDFDHTLICNNSDTYILRLLPDGSDLPQYIKKLYSTAGWNDYQREVFRYLHSCKVTKEHLLSCVAEISLIEGMHELLEYLVTPKITATKADAENKSSADNVEITARATVAENGVFIMQQQQSALNGTASSAVESEFSGSAVSASAVRPHSVIDGNNPSDSSVQFDIIIISDANSVLIDHILETAGLQSVFNKVYTNPASFDNSGCLQLSPYHQQDWCSMSSANMCKGHILDEHCRNSSVKYDVVAYVGDGTNDLCPALRLRETDIVFPRRHLSLDKRIAEGRDKVAAMVRSWDTGFDIMNALKEVLTNVAA